jgi:hypothetical protein
MSLRDPDPSDPSRRIIAVLAFLVVGVPPGLCSLYFTPMVLPSLWEFQSVDWLIVLLWLFGYACLGFAAVQVIRAWLPPPHHRTDR